MIAPADDRSIAPLCVDASGLAFLLDVSPRQIYRLRDSGKLPAPILLGGCVRWPVREIEMWISAGAPNRREWEATRDPQILACAPAR
jgi:predicted DNA-binding transcriptional regulator AlpA